MATYGKLRHTTIKGQAGTTWYVQLWKKDYTGSSTDMTLEGEGFNVKWSGQGGTRDRQFINSECVLNMFAQNATDEALIYDIFSEGDGNYYIRIYKNSLASVNIWWFGWVNPSFSKIENAPFPYSVNIKATDSIGTFSKRADDLLDLATYTNSYRINTHIKDFGDAMGLYDTTTNLVSDGNFPDPNTDWILSSAWTIPAGGGQIDYDGSNGTITHSSVVVTQGDDISFTFTILNLAEGESIDLAITNHLNEHLFLDEYVTFSSNGNHKISGEAQEGATGIKIYPAQSGSVTYSLTDVAVVEGLITNQSPCPIDNNWFQTSIDWWRSGDTYQSDDPFYLYRTTKAAYREDEEQKPKNYKEYDVLKGALKTFNSNCILANGKYNFIQPNSWLSNTDGILPFYQYAIGGDNQDTTSTNENNLVTIDGTTSNNKGAILSGSTITFEPAFKGVDATFISGATIVSINPDSDFTTGVTVGQLEASLSSDFMYFTFNLRHYETLLASAVDSSLGVDYSLRSNLIQTEFTLEVKLVSGSTVYYLRKFGNEHIWQETTQADFSISVGRGLENWSSLNSIDHTYPCSISKIGGDYISKSEYQFTPYFPQPPITGNLIVKLTGVSNYNKYEDGGSNWGIPFTILPSFNVTQENNLATGSVLVNTDSSSLSSDELGVTYASTFGDNSAEEQFDLGEIIVGNSGSVNADILYNVSYGDSLSAVTGFRQGGSGTYSNITQLLADEFLKPQTEPLEIIQADIFSPSITPISLLKYSINNDSSYNYYTFLGGEFSAQKETMSGEWYKINSSNPTVIQEPHSKLFSPTTDTDVNQRNLEFLSKTNKANVNSNSLAVLSVAIVTTSPTTSISVGSSLKSELAENQKVKLTYPDGSNSTTITVSDGYNDSATSINVNSFTSDIDYPIGSIISVAPYEITSLIQRFSSGGTVNSRSVGVNVIQEINFTPQDFNLASANGGHITTLDSGASVQISNDTKFMYAMKLVNKGKTLTKVMVFGSANYSYRVFEGFIFNNTTNLVGSGQANTELDITDIVGTSRNYIIIQIDVAATSDKVYGGYALVTNS